MLLLDVAVYVGVGLVWNHFHKTDVVTVSTNALLQHVVNVVLWPVAVLKAVVAWVKTK
jgi:hypothetical protein